MKKINLLVALTLSLNVFSQEMKKDTTHKKIIKLEKSKSYDTRRFVKTYGYVKLEQCKWVSSKGVRCKNEGYGGNCQSPNCASKK